MYKQYSFYLILTLLFFSCGNNNDTNSKNNVFVQPKVLEKNSEFNIDALTFNEDLRLLFSRSLDTVDNDYSLRNIEPALYPSKEKIIKEQREKYRRFVSMPEERYFFESFTLDSIATLNDIYFNKVAIETNKNLKIKAFLAYANFYSTKELDSALHKLYIKYGPTPLMKEQEKLHREHDSLRGLSTEPIEYYEKYLYRYKEHYANSQKINYCEWVLDDRILQLKIYEGFETKIDLTSGEIDTKNWHIVEYLFIKKEEYDSIKKILFKNMKEYEHGIGILKPYKIESLNYEPEYYRYTEEIDRIKEAKNKAELDSIWKVIQKGEY